MITRIRYAGFDVSGNVAETRQKYIGLATGSLAVARLKLREAADLGDLERVAALTNVIAELESQLRDARAAQPKEIDE